VERVYFVYPQDETTTFLLEIPNRISDGVGKAKIKFINVIADDASYSSCLEEITSLPDESIVVFMGHGQADRLWGAESDSYEKKPLISKSQSKVFSGKYLFCLSCYSNEFLRGTFSFSRVINSVGFGGLPTEMTEVKNSKKLTEMGVNESVIKKYKGILVDLVTDSFLLSFQRKLNFGELSIMFMLLLNKRISTLILENKKNSDNRILSDLLFQMKMEIIYI
jgi:hypothetical protein